MAEQAAEKGSYRCVFVPVMKEEGFSAFAFVGVTRLLGAV
jgi:hypothetical protein